MSSLWPLQNAPGKQGGSPPFPLHLRSLLHVAELPTVRGFFLQNDVAISESHSERILATMEQLRKEWIQVRLGGLMQDLLVTMPGGPRGFALVGMWTKLMLARILFCYYCRIWATFQHALRAKRMLDPKRTVPQLGPLGRRSDSQELEGDQFEVLVPQVWFLMHVPKWCQVRKGSPPSRSTPGWLVFGAQSWWWNQAAFLPARQQSLFMGLNALSHHTFWPQGASGGHHPYTEVSAPLGIHLQPSTRDKIWRWGECWFIFTTV